MDYILKNDRWKITKQLKRRLPKRRYIHSIAVAYTAAALAMVHDVDPQEAILAGLLHDYAKNIPPEEQLEYCKKHRIELTDYERENPQIIHGKVGALMAMKKYHIRDEDVINAVINHTIGRPGMSTLEKILFVADYIEPERKPLPGIEEIRKIAFRDLDLAVFRVLDNIFTYLKSLGHEVDEQSKATYEYYKKESGYVETGSEKED